MGRPPKPDDERVRDIPPTGIRIPLDLRAALMREAQINGRTLSDEILRRLRVSLDVDHVATVVKTGEPPGPLVMVGPREKPITDAHRMLLAAYDTLPPDKQLALLTFLKR